MRLTSIRLVALVTTALLALFVLRVLSTHGWSAESFILIPTPAQPIERGYDVGYDAQWYYHIAMDPVGAPPRLDQPGYRYQRIVHPLLVHLLSLGHPQAIPWAMLGINLTVSGLSALLLGSLLVARGASAWWGLVYFLSLGYLLTIRLDLLEPLALGLALAGYWAFERRRSGLAILFFGLSGLTKEVGLAFAVAVGLWLFLRKERRKGLLITAGGLLPYIAWNVIVYYWIGDLIGVTGRMPPVIPIPVPFLGFQLLTDPVSRLLTAIWVLGPALVLGLWASLDGLRIRFAGTQGRDALLVLVNAWLIATLPIQGWQDPIVILRTGLGLILAMLLWFASRHPRMLKFSAALWGPSALIMLLVPNLL